MSPFVVILIGPPGSGKGTQAEMLAENFGLHYFDNSSEFEGIIYDPKLQSNPVIREQRQRFESGLLLDPVWIAEQIVIPRSTDIFQSGQGITYSASPRSVPEAERLLPYLENTVGKERIFIFEIKLSPESSIFRNSHRRICKQCRSSLMWSRENEKLTQCPKCGGELVNRVLDNPDVIRERLRVYEEETRPVLSWLRKHGYESIPIDGEPPPEEVSREILSSLEQKLRAMV